ncbi:MAG: hemolysin family protein [Candidatus Eremiobacterota bacterium]
MSILTAGIILIFILVSAFYVGAEFSVVSSRRSRIKQMAEEGNFMAIRLLSVMQDSKKLNRYIACCQIGITISSLLLGSYGEATLARQLGPVFQKLGNLQEVAAHSTAAVVILILLTGILLVFGELIPKYLSLQYPTQTALITILPMSWSISLFSWFIPVISGSGSIVLKLIGKDEAAHRHIHSPEEIDLLIAESRDGGLLEPDEHKRLHQALQLSIRPAHQLMVPRLHINAIDVETSLDEILEKVAQCPYTRLPVYRGTIDNIIGMINIKDLVMHYLKHGHIKSIDRLMRPALFIPDTVKADRLLSMLKEKKCHQAMIVDEFGGVAGLITLEDVLAELVGEVGDEFKTQHVKAERLPDGRVRLPGIMRLDEAEQWTGIRWEGNVDTIGGYVTEILGHLPMAGEHLNIDGIELEIEEISHRAIGSILVKPVSQEEPNG